MSVRVSEIDAASAVMVVYGHVFRAGRPAAILDVFRLQSLEYLVEILVCDFEGIVMPLELVIIVEIETQSVVHLHDDEVRKLTDIFKPEYSGIKPRGLDLVMRRHNGVIKRDSHLIP